MKIFNQLSHPVLEHKLGYLREKKTQPYLFRNIIREISCFLAYEATRDLTTLPVEIETPLKATRAKRILEPPVIITIMRAGNAMFESMMDILPFAQGGHIGIYRDKFIKNTVEYYFKLPDQCQNRPVLLVDPLLATGDTAIASIDRLKENNVGKIKFLAILVSPQGLERLHHFHPDVDVYALSLEDGLTDEGYLLPGLGDAGNRLYKTK
jgi:uracil phosphoribosyltransferase